MTKSLMATGCALWLQATIACGSSTDDALGGTTGDRDSGSGGVVSASASTGGRGSGGRFAASGGATAAGGRNGTGSGGSPNAGAGGATGAGGTPGTGGAVTDGGTGGTAGGVGAGGQVGSGGTAGAGGITGSGGTVGDGGPPGNGGVVGNGGTASDSGSPDGGGVVCSPVHPNVNGSARTCNAGYCYCSGNDGCFPDAVASSCCVQGIVCGPGAVNPTVTINHPGDGETRAANEPIPFIGVADDPQDGALSGPALVWTSSELTGPIGTGFNFQAALPAGTHVITLTATDADSNTGTDTITLIIQ